MKNILRKIPVILGAATIVAAAFLSSCEKESASDLSKGRVSKASNPINWVEMELDSSKSGTNAHLSGYYYYPMQDSSTNSKELFAIGFELDTIAKAPKRLFFSDNLYTLMIVNEQNSNAKFFKEAQAGINMWADLTPFEIDTTWANVNYLPGPAPKPRTKHDLGLELIRLGLVDRYGHLCPECFPPSSDPIWYDQAWN